MPAKCTACESPPEATCTSRSSVRSSILNLHCFVGGRLELTGWGVSAVCHVAALVAGLHLGAPSAFERAQSPGSDSVISLQLEAVKPEAEYEPPEVPVVKLNRDELDEPPAPDAVATQTTRDHEAFQRVTPPVAPATELAVIADSPVLATPKPTRHAERTVDHPGRTTTRPERKVQSRRPTPAVRKIEAVAIGSDTVTPARPLQNRPPVYPDEAVRRGIEGKLVLKLTISASGTVSRVEVAESSGYRMLDDAAIAAVREWKFVPAHRGGQPVLWTARQPVRFRRN